jgi:inosine-uridine nucleoside N-ribohydrolase
VAITCVNGNTSLSNVLRNVQRVLLACGRTDVPVYSGASRSLLQPAFDASYYHGQDGMGDTNTDDEALDQLAPIQAEHAVSAMLRLCSEGMCVVPASNPTSVRTLVARWEKQRDVTKDALQTALNSARVRDAVRLKEDLQVCN